MSGTYSSAFQIAAPPIRFTCVYRTRLAFETAADDLTIRTAPFAHRRVTDLLEFGSLWAYPHSWATIGNDHFHEFNLKFTAAFRNPLPDGNCWIGVGTRSQHYYANFAHILYLNHDGSVVVTEPNENPPKFYEDTPLRGATPIDPASDHEFEVTFNSTTLSIRIDDFSKDFRLASMKKVLGPGVIACSHIAVGWG